MLHPDVQKSTSVREGLGLCAAKLIRQGTVVCAPSEGDANLKLTRRQVRALPKEAQHFVYQKGDRYVLALDGCQYLNHSCEPNLVWINDHQLAAARDIHPGEEVTFDYGTSESRIYWRHKWICNCGAANCRRVVTGRDCLDPSFQSRYAGHMPSWVLEFIGQNRGLRGVMYRLIYQAAELVRKLKGV